MATKKTNPPELNSPENAEEQSGIAAEASVTAAEDAMAQENRMLREQLTKMSAMMTSMQETMLQLQAQAAEKTPQAIVRQQDADYIMVKEACKAAEESGEDPWKIEIEVRAPRRPRGEDPWYWINVNGRSVQIPANDRRQKMKLPFANVLVEMLDADRRAEDYAASLEVYDPINNPHRE